MVSVQRILHRRNSLHASGIIRALLGGSRLRIQTVHWPVLPFSRSLRFFLLLITITFVAELTAAIVIFAVGDKIVDEIVTETGSQAEWDRLKENLMLVNYFVIGTIVVEGMLAVLVKCYIGSLRNKNSAYDYKIVDDEGNKMSLQEKRANDNAKIQEKYSKKREEMHQKYGYGNTQ